MIGDGSSELVGDGISSTSAISDYSDASTTASYYDEDELYCYNTTTMKLLLPTCFFHCYCNFRSNPTILLPLLQLLHWLSYDIIASSATPREEHDDYSDLTTRDCGTTRAPTNPPPMPTTLWLLYLDCYFHSLLHLPTLTDLALFLLALY
ncbi:hypothetical protein AMTRI_Chr10g228170 [Amborella trichopoda]